MLLLTANKPVQIISVYLFGVLLLMLTAHAQAAREVSAKRECATCHIMWLDEFKRKDIKSLIPYDPKPVTKSVKQDVSSTERMCFSCHDGFELDDRYMWKEDAHWHPTRLCMTVSVARMRWMGLQQLPIPHKIVRISQKWDTGGSRLCPLEDGYYEERYLPEKD